MFLRVGRGGWRSNKWQRWSRQRTADRTRNYWIKFTVTLHLKRSKTTSSRLLSKISVCFWHVFKGLINTFFRHIAYMSRFRRLGRLEIDSYYFCKWILHLLNYGARVRTNWAPRELLIGWVSLWRKCAHDLDVTAVADWLGIIFSANWLSTYDLGHDVWGTC